MMAARKHTPGPWSVEDPLGPEILSIVAGGPDPYNWIQIAQLSAKGDAEDGDPPANQAKANAHLLAAGPELLTILRAMHVMLRGIVDFVDIDPVTTSLTVSASGEPIATLTVAEILQRADAVIAKAEAR